MSHHHRTEVYRISRMGIDICPTVPVADNFHYRQQLLWLQYLLLNVCSSVCCQPIVVPCASGVQHAHEVWFLRDRAYGHGFEFGFRLLPLFFLPINLDFWFFALFQSSLLLSSLLLPLLWCLPRSTDCVVSKAGGYNDWRMFSCRCSRFYVLIPHFLLFAYFFFSLLVVSHSSCFPLGVRSLRSIRLGKPTCVFSGLCYPWVAVMSFWLEVLGTRDYDYVCYMGLWNGIQATDHKRPTRIMQCFIMRDDTRHPWWEPEVFYSCSALSCPLLNIYPCHSWRFGNLSEPLYNCSVCTCSCQRAGCALASGTIWFHDVKTMVCHDIDANGCIVHYSTFRWIMSISLCADRLWFMFIYFSVYLFRSVSLYIV